MPGLLAIILGHKGLGGANAHQQLFDAADVNVAVHVRRGDALSMHGAMKSDKYYAHIINRVIALVRAANPARAVKVHIFTDGSRGIGGKYEWKNLHYVDENGKQSDLLGLITECSDCVTMQIGVDALVSFHSMVTADILVSGSSMFSNFAGQISRNMHISSESVRSTSPRSRILARETTGVFDEAEFARKWATYGACNADQRPNWKALDAGEHEDL